MYTGWRNTHTQVYSLELWCCVYYVSESIETSMWDEANP